MIHRVAGTMTQGTKRDSAFTNLISSSNLSTVEQRMPDKTVYLIYRRQ